MRIKGGRRSLADIPAMSTKLLEKYGGAVPRYTSYPTAPHFGPSVDAGVYADWLAQLPARTPVSLYVHIPFCNELCWFCGCNTKATRRYEPIAAYLDGLFQEIELVVGHLPNDLTISHLHFGGGSPTLLSAADFTRLMTVLGERFAILPEAEIAIEVDPRTADVERIHAYADAGVNRASIGIQDFDPAVQTAINRVQPFDLTASTVAELRAAGIQRLNFDLMYGLPYQTVDSVAAMIRQAVRLAPDRVALFGYAHVPWMKKHQRLVPAEALPDAKARFEQQQIAAERMTAADYVPVGLDHFATPGDPLARAAAASDLHRNFQGYTTDGTQALIGLGASAIGALPQGYVQNRPQTRAYLENVTRGRLAVAKGVALNDEDRIRREAIEQLMCRLRLDLADPRFAPLADSQSARLQALEADGLLSISNGELVVKETGRPFLRQVAATFDAYLTAPQGGRHSAAI